MNDLPHILHLAEQEISELKSQLTIMTRERDILLNAIRALGRQANPILPGLRALGIEVT